MSGLLVAAVVALAFGAGIRIAIVDVGTPAVAPEPAVTVAAAEASSVERTPEAATPVIEPEEAASQILVSLSKRRLYLVSGRDTVLDAPVAIGKGEDFEFDGKKYYFATPKGRRRIIAKEQNPVWVVPEWHYFEKAVRKKLQVYRLEKDSRVELRDGSFIAVLDNQVGRVNRNGYFAPFTPGNEIIFDGKIFIPPMNSAQRKVPDALGPYKLDMGDGYLIHGTHLYNSDSIGEAVSHGCVRMNNSDLDRLYHLVEKGTPVVIF
jgi:lipoprotein-anchoring transpeptidase ErfK/SrfK